MTAPVYTQAQADALAAAIARGAKKVRYASGGTSQEVEYHSLAEMQALLADMRAQLAPRPNRKGQVSRLRYLPR